MSETNPKNHYPVPPSSSSSSSGVPSDNGPSKFRGEKRHINPPETEIPDTATLRDQWRYATRQYGKWYSHAWGTAILAGAAFFALGWVIKGENPLPSFHSKDPSPPSSSHEKKKPSP